MGATIDDRVAKLEAEVAEFKREKLRMFGLVSDRSATLDRRVGELERAKGGEEPWHRVVRSETEDGKRIGVLRGSTLMLERRRSGGAHVTLLAEQHHMFTSERALLSMSSGKNGPRVFFGVEGYEPYLSVTFDRGLHVKLSLREDGAIVLARGVAGGDLGEEVIGSVHSLGSRRAPRGRMKRAPSRRKAGPKKR